jgi:DNA-binding transcriptional MerR regulator
MSITEINKVPEPTLSIGAVAKEVGVPVYTIRYWEKEFSAFLNPQRCCGGHRRYRRYDVDILKRIKSMLWEEKYSIAGARQKLQGLLLGRSEDDQQLMLTKLAEILMSQKAVPVNR